MNKDNDIISFEPQGPNKKGKPRFVKDGVVPSIFPWSSPSSAQQDANEAEAVPEQEIPAHVKLTCEVDISAMKEEEEESFEIATEEEEDDFGEPTLHCGECNFKTRSGVDALGGNSIEKSLACFSLKNGLRFHFDSEDMSKLSILEHFLNVGNLTSKLE